MLNQLKEKRIAIDIDDVISVTIPSLIHYIDEFHDLQINYEDFIEYELPRLKAFSERKIEIIWAHEIWNWFFGSVYWKNMQTVLWCKEVIMKLKNCWFEITLITARWSLLKSYTEEWLKSNFPDDTFNEIFFTWVFWWEKIPKSRACKKLWIKFMIEDNAKNCIELAKNGIESFLFPRPWNINIETNDKKITRISSWDEIII